MDVADIERRLSRVRKILHAQTMALLLKGESIGGFDEDFLIVNDLLQYYKKLKDQIVSIDLICKEDTPPELQSENRVKFLNLLADGEKHVTDTVQMLEDQTCLLGKCKNLGVLEVMKDLNEATDIFKRRVRRKLDREKQDKADETEGASVA